MKLKSEKEIISSWKGNIESPMVSICCITFNHEAYIEDTIEGFLRQETTFPYEILIHDDASPDRTAEIILSYQEKYPKLIKPIIQVENQYSKGINPDFEFNYPRAQGKYIALCEGDDYWTAPNKLQKQVDFLEENKDFVASCHVSQVVDENKNKRNIKLNHYQIPSNYFSIKDMENFKLPGQIGSIVYRNFWNNLDDNIRESYKLMKVSGDRKLALILVLKGRIYRFPEKMSDYRYVSHKGTSWTARNGGKNLALKKYNDLIQLENFAEKSYGIKLNFKKQRLLAFFTAFVFFLKQPNAENRKIIRGIISLKYDNIFEFIFFTLIRISTSPIRLVNRKLKAK